MSTLADRLRGVIAGVGAPPKGPFGFGPLPGGTHVEGDDVARYTCGSHDVAEALGGAWCESGSGRFLVVDRTYTPGHRHGDVTMADALPPSDGVWPRLALLAGPGERIGAGSLLFVDLETTGLAGGAGSYAFLVGCAWFDGGTFRIRQFFLSDFGAERSLLVAVQGAVESAGAIVTYNGKTFDMPLMETRFIMHRMPAPFGAVPHIDMLHPARRLWRGAGDEGGSCRLSALEQAICGHAREGDVPGFEIPSRYFHFVRTGDPRPLVPVFEHNRLDLLSLALLTSHAAQLLEEGPGAARTAREAYGAGRLYERSGVTLAAKECFARAVDLPGDVATHAEALRAFAVLARRDRRYAEAAAAWGRIIALQGCPPHIVREATEALAVHHEHRLRDPRTARAFALEALQLHETPTRRHAIHHRLARLDRKMARPQPALAPLF
jgi:uncharacterized protein YprB with RNaseH-like and TPR domain